MPSDFALNLLVALAKAPSSVRSRAKPINDRFGRYENTGGIKFGRWRGAIRKRRLARAEHHVAVALGYSPSEIAAGIDWSAVDWASVIAFVVKVLLILLPL